jgi:hypothetical protein
VAAASSACASAACATGVAPPPPLAPPTPPNRALPRRAAPRRPLPAVFTHAPGSGLGANRNPPAAAPPPTAPPRAASGTGVRPASPHTTNASTSGEAQTSPKPPPNPREEETSIKSSMRALWRGIARACGRWRRRREEAQKNCKRLDCHVITA